MQKIYVWGGAAVLGAMVLGTLTATLVQRGTDEFAACRGTIVAGGAIGGPFTLLDGDGKTVNRLLETSGFGHYREHLPEIKEFAAKTTA